jgi:hypothetical protein
MLDTGCWIPDESWPDTGYWLLEIRKLKNEIAKID